MRLSPQQQIARHLQKMKEHHDEAMKYLKQLDVKKVEVKSKRKSK